MNRRSAVLLLEFNELSPRLMERFIDEGKLPSFRRLRDSSLVAITDPQEPQDGLEPWIQWVTVHTGVERAEHGLEKLGEAGRLASPTIGQAVSGDGRSVWMCGSMNLPRSAAGGGWYLPDPWNPDSVPEPSQLRTFSDFVRANVQEHSNASAEVLSPPAIARFGWFLARHGLRPRTVRAALRQLRDERRGRIGSWARASVLDRFQWDLFRWGWKRTQPSFASFFSNSTAHYQHVYWRNLEPERFEQAPTPEEQRRYSNAIRHGYERMDELVGEAMELADESGATVVFCTGLSQQPYLRGEEIGGKYIHRPHRVEDLIDVLGLESARQVAPVMAEQFHLFFDDESAATRAEKQLADCTVAGRPAFATRRVDDDLFFGCAIHDQLPDDAEMCTPSGAVRFGDVFYRSDAPKSGFHHPDGMLWIRSGQHKDVGRVPLTAVAPTILQLLGVMPPATMTAPPIAVSLRG